MSLNIYWWLVDCQQMDHHSKAWPFSLMQQPTKLRDFRGSLVKSLRKVSAVTNIRQLCASLQKTSVDLACLQRGLLAEHCCASQANSAWGLSAWISRCMKDEQIHSHLLSELSLRYVSGSPRTHYQMCTASSIHQLPWWHCFDFLWKYYQDKHTEDTECMKEGMKIWFNPNDIRSSGRSCSFRRWTLRKMPRSICR